MTYLQKAHAKSMGFYFLQMLSVSELTLNYPCSSHRSYAPTAHEMISCSRYYQPVAPMGHCN